MDTQRVRVTARIPVGTLPGSLAIEGGSVWVANTGGTASGAAGANTLSRIDPLANRVAQTIAIEIGGPITAGFGAVFVPGARVGGGPLRRVDARTGRIVATFGFSGIPAVACGSLWVAQTDVPDGDGPTPTTIRRLDPVSGAQLQAIRFPEVAEPPAHADGRCLTIAGANRPDEESEGTIAVIGAQGVEHRSPVIHAFLRTLNGRIWTQPAAGLLQQVDVNGAAVGVPLAVVNGVSATWTLLPVGDQAWLVDAASALRVTL